MKLSQYPSVHLLIALGMLFLGLPIVGDLPRGDLVESVLFTLVMVAAVRAVGGSRRTHFAAFVIFSPTLVANWLNKVRPDVMPHDVTIFGTIIFFGFVVANLLRYIVLAPTVDTNVLCAGVAGFLLLGFLWAPAYLLVARLDPGAFNVPAGSGGSLTSFDAFYFSFVTLSTIGYGDVTPVSKFARMLAMSEGIAGLFYMAVLVSRLVSMHASNAKSQ